MLGLVHQGNVTAEFGALGCCFRVCACLDRGALLFSFPIACLGFPQVRPDGNDQANHQRGRNRSGRCKNQFVSPNKFPKAVRGAGGTCQHRFIVEVPLNVHCQAVRRFIAAGAIFLHRLHYDPIQVAAEDDNELVRFTRVRPGDRG